MIDNSIEKLVNYALRAGLIGEEDRVWAENSLLAALGLESFERPARTEGSEEFESILAELIAFGPAADMLQNGTLDGAWIMSGAPAAAVSQALSSGCKLLDIDDATLAALQEKYPWYARFVIAADTYPNQPEPVKTSAIKMVMFCRGDLPEDLVYSLTKSFWEHIDELGAAQKNLKGLKPEDAVKDIANRPLHPGAEKYYKEIGVIK